MGGTTALGKRTPQSPGNVAIRSRRTAMATLSTPTSGYLNNAEMTFRVSFCAPETTLRWRFRIRNYRVLSEAAVLAGASFTGCYHGQQALDTAGQPTGGFVNAPRQASGAFTLAADGSEYVSSWITAPADQLSGGLPWLFSFAYTGGGTSNGQASGQGQLWYVTGAGSSANLANQAATGLSVTGAVPFDIRIEYDVFTKNRVGLAVGDSITYVTASAVISQQFSYPQVYSRRTGNHLVNCGVPSVTLQQWQNSTSDWKWQRFTPSSVPYDFAVIALGTNDIANNTSLANLKTYFLTLVSMLRGLGINEIHACTILPRNLAHGRLATPMAAGATTVTVYESGLTAGNVQIGEGGTIDNLTTTGTPTDNGNGTYTYTTTAGASFAHKAGELMALSQETVRLGFNSWLRGLPGGITSSVSHDRLLQSSYDRALIQPEFCQSDNLHPTLAGAALMAEALRM